MQTEVHAGFTVLQTDSMTGTLRLYRDLTQAMQVGSPCPASQCHSAGLVRQAPATLAAAIAGLALCKEVQQSCNQAKLKAAYASGAVPTL